MALLWLVLVLVVAGTIAAIRFRRRGGRQRALMVLCDRTGVEFSALDPFNDSNFLPFRLFGRGDTRGFENVIWDRGDDGAVRVFDYWFEERDDDGIGVKHDLTCAVVPLPFGVPPLAVVPRGMAEVTREPTETRTVTLDLDAFNRWFEVRAADPRAAVAFLDQRMMQALMRLPLRVAMHVNEDRMLLVAPSLEPGEMLLLLEASRAPAKRVPPVVASLYPPRPAVGPYERRWLQGSWSPDPTSARPNLSELGG